VNSDAAVLWSAARQEQIPDGLQTDAVGSHFLRRAVLLDVNALTQRRPMYSVAART